jgi:DNA polymerase elongation subunit (family B)
MNIIRRTDKPAFVKNVYSKILRMIMNSCTLIETLEVLISEIKSLLNNQIHIDDLTITKPIHMNYQCDTFYLKIFSDKLKKDPKVILNDGDLVKFVVVQNSSSDLLGDKIQLVEDYLKSQNGLSPYIINYDYYIKKELMVPIDELFKTAFSNDINKLQCISFKSTIRAKPIYLKQPVKMIYELIKINYDMDEFLSNIRLNIK